MDIAGFNSAFSGARRRIRSERADVGREQERLRALVSADDPAEDRDWALRLIESLAVPPAPPRQWSALYDEAGAIHADSYRTGDTVEERIAALQEARRRIWAIADRAPEDEAPHIRAMTRVLDHLEAELREPSWTDGPAGPGS
ncbi:hypothetical protein EV652_111101 [Kribbella steppae]|uniref:Uncharacterized protein n=1 Tax=Kribbella steppae TaxID=2512223 RepID=A0A4R2H745_9ACTN|nr:hypothetical protein [Kribbella steppae]TCO21194.1 hypothetical protein EV652_111101 [Kribbella steppae]